MNDGAAVSVLPHGLKDAVTGKKSSKHSACDRLLASLHDCSYPSAPPTVGLILSITHELFNEFCVEDSASQINVGTSIRQAIRADIFQLHSLLAGMVTEATGVEDKRPRALSRPSLADNAPSTPSRRPNASPHGSPTAAGAVGASAISIRTSSPSPQPPMLRVSSTTETRGSPFMRGMSSDSPSLRANSGASPPVANAYVSVTQLANSDWTASAAALAASSQKDGLLPPPSEFFPPSMMEHAIPASAFTTLRRHIRAMWHTPCAEVLQLIATNMLAQFQASEEGSAANDLLDLSEAILFSTPSQQVALVQRLALHYPKVIRRALARFDGISLHAKPALPGSTALPTGPTGSKPESHLLQLGSPALTRQISAANGGSVEMAARMASVQQARSIPEESV